MRYDVFNGDADGIFALHQYRLSFPEKERQLITGVKRDIQLLRQIDGENLQITVFDISFAANRTAIPELLEKGCEIHWFDHHFPGEIPQSPLLHTMISTSPECCTSLLVNNHLQGRFIRWALCGAFGDNLHQTAYTLASRISLQEKEIRALAELGELVNYNAYGANLEDLHVHPALLYQAILSYENPLDFIAEGEEIALLRSGYQDDMTRAGEIAELQKIGKNRLYFFPDAAWTRRVSGVFSNLKARERRDVAHAIITENGDSFRISVRAPMDAPRNADILCRSFPTGGGRAAAAGINKLPKSELSRFCKAFSAIYPSS